MQLKANILAEKSELTCEGLLIQRFVVVRIACSIKQAIRIEMMFYLS